MQSGDSKKEKEERAAWPSVRRGSDGNLPPSLSLSLSLSFGCNMMSILPKRDVFYSLPFTESAETTVALGETNK